MSSIIIFFGVVILLFIIIVLFNLRFRIKQRKKIEPEKKEKKDNNKQAKEEKIVKKENKVENKNNHKKSDKFVRPRDLLEQQRKNASNISLVSLDEKSNQNSPTDNYDHNEDKVLGEGETDNANFTEKTEKLEKTQEEEIEIIEPNISEEIKNLSPEMKALLFGDVLKNKE